MPDSRSVINTLFIRDCFCTVYWIMPSSFYIFLTLLLIPGISMFKLDICALTLCLWLWHSTPIYISLQHQGFFLPLGTLAAWHNFSFNLAILWRNNIINTCVFLYPGDLLDIFWPEGDIFQFHIHIFLVLILHWAFVAEYRKQWCHFLFQWILFSFISGLWHIAYAFFGMCKHFTTIEG